MKNRKSFIKLLLLVILGAIIGITGNIILRFSEAGIQNFFAEMGVALKHTGLIIESLLFLVVAVVLISIYIYVRKLWKQEEASDDDMADVCGEKFEHWAQIGLTIANTAVGVLLIFACVAFPDVMVNFSDKDAIRFVLLSLVMLLGCIFTAVMEILIYHLMQKRDPKKKGDPSSFSFDKKWLESCDETEKLVIYQAGYKAFNSMQVLMIVGIILSIFGKMQFGTGNFPLILLGCMWVIGMLNYGRWKMKGLTKK